jgi:sugar phosphate isomerase/epimerase
MILVDEMPPLGLAHFTVLEAPPLDLVMLAASTGFAFIGLRLGALCYEIAPGSQAMRAIRARLDGEGVRIHDIEVVTIGADFVAARLAPVLAAAGELGARRLSVCGDEPDPARMVASFAELCELASVFGMGVDLECMAWRRVGSLPAAVRVVRAAGRPNGGVLVDALHLARTGGAPDDLRQVPAELIVSAQLCDAPAARPASEEAIIHEARAGRLLPGHGELPLCELLAALPAHAAISVEVPIAGSQPPERRAREIHAATRALLERCRRHQNHNLPESSR